MTDATKRPASDAVAPDAKKAKTPDLAVIKKQIEYYFSDQNLKGDKFFHEKISADPDGWLAMNLIQSCNKIKVMGVPDDVLLDALKDSSLETKTVEGGNFVRRTTPPPALDEKLAASKRVKPDDAKKKEMAHIGGLLIKFSEIPEELNWIPIKEAVKAKIPENSRVMFATTVSEKGTSVMVLTPFDNDLEVIENMVIEVDGQKIKFAVMYGEELRECLKELPKHIVKRRETLAKTRTKAKQKPVQLANQKFANIATVKAKVKEIITARKDGQVLIEGSPDTALVFAVFAHHPRADEKLKSVKGIKVDTSEHDADEKGKKSRCFHLMKEDGTTEDISVIKCLSELERKLNAGELDAKAEPASTEKAEEKAEVKTEEKAEVKAE
jgi:hypothetical protein